jgi:ubiquinone/menaquinone biosynthesis C-methylase UbiE
MFWDALAPHLSLVEDNYLDARSARRLMSQLHEPVLVVGAGQGLIVAEIRKKGIRCDGVDWSAEMVKFAKLRRGIDLILADGNALPIADGAYATVIYATGVIDFMGDEREITAMLREGRRVARDPGKMFVAFYRQSEASESFIVAVGLLKGNVMDLRESLKLYLMNPVQMTAWVAKRTGRSLPGAAALMLRMLFSTTMQEKRLTLNMQKVFRRVDDPRLLLDAAPESQPYRNEAEIRRLFDRLETPLQGLERFASCYIARI